MSDKLLSEMEVTALMQIGAGAKLDDKHRRVLQRLFDLGLIDEGAAGMRLTAAGQARFELEAKSIGLTGRP
jgi:hypothetical protein